MSVLVTTTVPLDLSVYDEISQQATPMLLAAKGFRAHFAHANSADTFVVDEIWDSSQDHADFFDNNIKPNLPPGTTVSVAELHNVVLPKTTNRS